MTTVASSSIASLRTACDDGGGPWPCDGSYARCFAAAVHAATHGNGLREACVDAASDGLATASSLVLFQLSLAFLPIGVLGVSLGLIRQRNSEAPAMAPAAGLARLWG